MRLSPVWKIWRPGKPLADEPEWILEVFYAVNEKQLIPGFEQPDYDCADWADVAVPAHVQLEDTAFPSTATPSTHGTAGRILSRAKFPSVSTRWHAM